MYLENNLTSYISREPDIVVPIEEATKKKKKKKKKNKDNSVDNSDQNIEITDNVQSSKDQSSENTDQNSKKQKKKHRKQHTLNKLEPSDNDSEVHNIGTKDNVYIKKKQHKNSSEVNEEDVHREKQINSENREENSSISHDQSSLGQEVSDNSKNSHTIQESIGTLQETTELKIQKAIVSKESTLTNVERSMKKRKKRKSDGFSVELVKNQTPSTVGENKNNLKRKLDSNSYQVPNKNKKNKTSNKKHRDFSKLKQQGFKNKQGNDTSDNPLNKLSDERLKAYGLNPKKYRSFLKYKKF